MKIGEACWAVTKDGDTKLLAWGFDHSGATKWASQNDEHFPETAPHRVVRVMLVECKEDSGNEA